MQYIRFMMNKFLFNIKMRKKMKLKKLVHLSISRLMSVVCEKEKKKIRY